MKVIKFTLLTLFFSGTYFSCQKEYFETPVLDQNVPVSFSKDLQPIFTRGCALNGCHNKTISPNLLKGESYASLIDGGFVDTLIPEESVLMLELNGNMPPTGKLPAAELGKFLNWIKQGAKDN
jgi:hypothetical protein